MVKDQNRLEQVERELKRVRSLKRGNVVDSRGEAVGKLVSNVYAPFMFGPEVTTMSTFWVAAGPLDGGRFVAKKVGGS